MLLLYKGSRYGRLSFGKVIFLAGIDNTLLRFVYTIRSVFIVGIRLRLLRERDAGLAGNLYFILGLWGRALIPYNLGSWVSGYGRSRVFTPLQTSLYINFWALLLAENSCFDIGIDVIYIELLLCIRICFLKCVFEC